MRIEWVVSKLVFIFDNRFFDRLLKEKDSRAFDCFLNLFFFILLFMPIYTIIKILYTLIFYTRFVYFRLFRDPSYHHTKLYDLTEMYDDLVE